MTKLHLEIEVEAPVDELLSLLPSLRPDVNAAVISAGTTRFRDEPATSAVLELETLLKAIDGGTLPYDVTFARIFVAPVSEVSWAIEFTGAPTNNQNFNMPNTPVRSRTSTLQNWNDFLVGANPTATATNFEGVMRVYFGETGPPRVSPFGARDGQGWFNGEMSVSRAGPIVTLTASPDWIDFCGPDIIFERITHSTSAGTMTGVTTTMTVGPNSTLGEIYDLAVP